jgi:enoyl-CoA hydratase
LTPVVEHRHADERSLVDRRIAVGHTVVVEEGGVAVVTLERPEARNALGAQQLAALTTSFRAIAADATVRAVVVTGADPAFCSGLDLRELSADADSLMAVAMADETNPWRALRELPQPVIGAVNGPAVTGGLELALACDFLVASPEARFADTHAKVGVLPAQGSTALLAAAVGVPMAKYLTFTGVMIDAAEAHRIGLVSLVVPHAELLTRARRIAAELASARAEAVRALKTTFEQGLLGGRREWLALEAELAAGWQLRTAPPSPAHDEAATP